MSKWKQRLSVLLVALFIIVTFMGNISVQASKVNTSKKKNTNVTRKIKKSKKSSVSLKNKKSKETVKNKKKGVLKKSGVKKQQNKKNILKTAEKKKIKDESKTPKVITFITPGVIRGGKSVKLPQNINGDAKFTAEKITYNNGNISRDLYISADNCNFNNVNVNGTIYVDPGENGNATLNNIICSELKILSGGKNSIHLNNVKVNKNLLIGNEKIEDSAKTFSGGASKENNKIKEPIRVEIKGQTSIQNTQVSSNAILDVVEGSFGNINILGTESEKNIIEFRGTFDKTVSVQSSSTIKTNQEVVLPEIKINIDKNDSKVLLDGVFKTVMVNKISKVDIAPKSIIENIIVNTKSEINVDRTATIKKTDDRFKCINVTNVIVPTISTGSTPATTPTTTPKKTDEVEVYIRVEGYNHTVVSNRKIKVKIFDLKPYLGKCTGSSGTKSSGWGVDKFTEPTVAHALVAALRDQGVKYDLQDYGLSCYAAMIDGDRELEKGQASGWMYKVNGVNPNIGCQAYKLKGGENILWYYGAYGFKTLYSTIDTDKEKVKVGDAVTVFLNGGVVDDSTGQNNSDPIEDATILVNGREFKVNGKVVKTDSSGKAVLRFDHPGKYSITATRIRSKGEESGRIDIVKPLESIVNVIGNSSDSPSTSTNVSVESVSFDTKEVQIFIGEEKQLVANIIPGNATNTKLSWKSSDENIARVYSNGKVVGLSTGKAEITVTTDDGRKTASCSIIVNKKDGGSSETDKGQDLTKVIDKDSGTSLLIQRSTDNTIKMVLGEVEGKALQNNTVVTITLFNPDNELKYIGQAVIKDGKLEFNTCLENGKYYGFYSLENKKKVKIEEFEVK